MGDIIENDKMPIGIAQTHAFNTMRSLDEILVNTDRLLNTPLPVAYPVAISQDTTLKKDDGTIVRKAVISSGQSL